MKFFYSLLFCALILAGCNSSKISNKNSQKNYIKGLPPSIFSRGKLKQVPKYNSNSNDLFSPDLRSCDLTEADLSKNLTDLIHSTFNSKTIWPENIPIGFNPVKIMNIGKNPGLGIRKLHKEGITGKGISIAIIDSGLLTNHDEYGKNLKFYENLHCLDKHAEMHGSSVSSIAVGKTIGVAPDASLYYIACTSGTYGKNKFKYNYQWLAKAIDKVLEINKTLPAKNKIRVISISNGWDKNYNGYKEVDAAMDRAIKQGIFVVTSTEPMLAHYGFRYSGLGKDVYSDPEILDSYTPISKLIKDRLLSQKNLDYKNKLYFPMDSKTVASPTGLHEYVFYRNGGISWIVPYIAGLYALACQIDKNMTPSLFWQTALKTGSYIDVKYDNKDLKFGKIINPAKLIHSLKK
jgi:hypothetical protein